METFNEYYEDKMELKIAFNIPDEDKSPWVRRSRFMNLYGLFPFHSYYSLALRAMLHQRLNPSNDSEKYVYIRKRIGQQHESGLFVSGWLSWHGDKLWFLVDSW